MDGLVRGMNVHVQGGDSDTWGFLAIGETLLVQSVPESSLWGKKRGDAREQVFFVQPEICVACSVSGGNNWERLDSYSHGDHDAFFQYCRSNQTDPWPPSSSKIVGNKDWI